MAARGTWYTPTLCVSHCDDYLKRLGVPDYTLRKQAAAAAEHIASCRRAAEAGVTICTGTDLLPSDEIDAAKATVREIELLVEDAGLTPLEPIRAATANGARLCGIDDVTGTLEAGKCGDFIIVAGRPDERIRDLRALRLVSKGCRLVWCDLPGLKKSNFNVTQPGVPCDGGVFRKW
jgi:imidazolonepropionase-like amidohydrolase